MLKFSNRRKQVVRSLLCTLESFSLGPAWRKKDGDEEGGGSYALSSQLQGVLEEIPCVAGPSDWRTLVEILIRNLEYRGRHRCEPGDFFWSSTTKCESPASTWVENRIIQHPCYPWYASQISWRTRVNFLLTLFCFIASDLAQNPVRFLPESFVGHGIV